MSRTLVFAAIPVAALVVGGAIQIGRPLPPLQARPVTDQLKLPGQFQVAFPARGQAAVGEQSLGVVAETPNQEPVAIASLTKMMTAYLLLKAKPLRVGEDGPVTVMTAADVQTYEKDKALGYSVAKVSAGDRLTERQLLEALLLPSADNIATLIATQVAGSEAAFVDKMNEAARELGMTKTHYADPSGVNSATVSTAHDQILMARAAMQDRIFREVVRMPQSRLPTAGIVYNVNFLVGKQGISGVKTGSTLAAGSCFVGSYPMIVDGAPRTVFCAILGQQSLRVALTENAAILRQAASQFKTYPLTMPAIAAEIHAPWKQQAALNLSKPLAVFGYPGMKVELGARLTKTTVPVLAHDEVAALEVTTGASSQSVALRAAQAIQSPGMFWRLHR